MFGCNNDRLFPEKDTVEDHVSNTKLEKGDHRRSRAGAVFGCNNDRLFPEKDTVEDHVSNTKLEKGDHYYIQTRHKDLFPIKILF